MSADRRTRSQKNELVIHLPNVLLGQRAKDLEDELAATREGYDSRFALSLARMEDLHLQDVRYVIHKISFSGGSLLRKSV